MEAEKLTAHLTDIIPLMQYSVHLGSLLLSSTVESFLPTSVMYFNGPQKKQFKLLLLRPLKSI